MDGPNPAHYMHYPPTRQLGCLVARWYRALHFPLPLTSNCHEEAHRNAQVFHGMDR